MKTFLKSPYLKGVYKWLQTPRSAEGGGVGGAYGGWRHKPAMCWSLQTLGGGAHFTYASPSVKVWNVPWSEVYKINHTAKLQKTPQPLRGMFSKTKGTGERIWTYCSVRQNATNDQWRRHVCGMLTALLLAADECFSVLHFDGLSKFSIMRKN